MQSSHAAAIADALDHQDHLIHDNDSTNSGSVHTTPLQQPTNSAPPPSSLHLMSMTHPATHSHTHNTHTHTPIHPSLHSSSSSILSYMSGSVPTSGSGSGSGAAHHLPVHPHLSALRTTIPYFSPGSNLSSPRSLISPAPRNLTSPTARQLTSPIARNMATLTSPRSYMETSYAQEEDGPRTPNGAGAGGGKRAPNTNTSTATAVADAETAHYLSEQGGDDAEMQHINQQVAHPQGADDHRRGSLVSVASEPSPASSPHSSPSASPTVQHQAQLLELLRTNHLSNLSLRQQAAQAEERARNAQSEEEDWGVEGDVEGGDGGEGGEAEAEGEDGEEPAQTLTYAYEREEPLRQGPQLHVDVEDTFPPYPQYGPHLPTTTLHTTNPGNLSLNIPSPSHAHAHAHTLDHHTPTNHKVMGDLPSPARRIQHNLPSPSSSSHHTHTHPPLPHAAHLPRHPLQHPFPHPLQHGLPLHYPLTHNRPPSAGLLSSGGKHPPPHHLLGGKHPPPHPALPMSMSMSGHYPVSHTLHTHTSSPMPHAIHPHTQIPPHPSQHQQQQQQQQQQLQHAHPHAHAHVAAASQRFPHYGGKQGPRVPMEQLHQHQHQQQLQHQHQHQHDQELDQEHDQDQDQEEAHEPLQEIDPDDHIPSEDEDIEDDEDVRRPSKSRSSGGGKHGPPQQTPSRTPKAILDPKIWWICPGGCGKTLKKTSYRSLKAHRTSCPLFLNLPTHAQRTSRPYKKSSSGSEQTFDKNAAPSPTTVSVAHALASLLEDPPEDGEEGSMQQISPPQSTSSSPTTISLRGTASRTIRPPGSLPNSTRNVTGIPRIVSYTSDTIRVFWPYAFRNATTMGTVGIPGRRKPTSSRNLATINITETGHGHGHGAITPQHGTHPYPLSSPTSTALTTSLMSLSQNHDMVTLAINHGGNQQQQQQYYQAPQHYQQQEDENGNGNGSMYHGDMQGGKRGGKRRPYSRTPAEEEEEEDPMDHFGEQKQDMIDAAMMHTHGDQYTLGAASSGYGTRKKRKSEAEQQQDDQQKRIKTETGNSSDGSRSDEIQAQALEQMQRLDQW